MPSLPREIRDLARALVETAQSDNSVPTVMADLRTVVDAFAQDATMLASFSETTIPLETRQQALMKALKDKVHPYVVNALLALQKRELLKLLSAYLASALAIAERTAQYAEATVTTAVPLTKEERSDLEKALTTSFGGTLNIRENVDPSILGGLIADVGGKRIDASVKGKIHRLKLAITSN